MTFKVCIEAATERRHYEPAPRSSADDGYNATVYTAVQVDRDGMCLNADEGEKRSVVIPDVGDLGGLVYVLSRKCEEVKKCGDCPMRGWGIIKDDDDRNYLLNNWK